MDDMERFATTALLLLVIVRLVKEVKGVLEPMPRWPAGGREAIERKKSEGEEDDDWLTPEEEFERWAKGGARPGRKRLLVSVSQALLVVLAVPVWWRTTAIVRAPIPTRAISSETAMPPLAFEPPVVHVTLPRDESSELVSAVLKGAASCSAADLRVRALPGVEATRLAELARLTDLDVDVWANSRDGDEALPAGDYRLVFLPQLPDDDTAGGDDDTAGVTLVVGTGRTAWVRLRSGADDAETLDAATRATRLAGECLALGKCGGGESEPGDPESDFSPLTPDGRALLSFTLANASPDRERGHVYSWRFGSDVEDRFLRHTSAALSRLGGFETEGQVLYHAKSAGERSRWDDDKKAFVTPSSELPFFVDSEWSLDTSVGELAAKPLHFVVYVPPSDECPLLVLREDGTPSPANGFVVPGWGGVVVWNPPTCGGGTSSDGGNKSYLSGSDLERAMEAAVGQLRQLLGLSPSPPHADIDEPKLNIRSVPASSAGFATWEVDVLVRRRAAVGHRAAMDSLDSLAAVVKAMPEMDVPKALAEAAGESLSESRLAREAAVDGRLEDAAVHARNSHAHAESAFFHPQIISLLYFPQEYKLAVYIPLFLPTLFPLFTGLMWDVKFYVRRTRCAAEHRRRAGKAD